MSAALLTYVERVAEIEAMKAFVALMQATEAYHEAGFGSHVTQPLRDALANVDYSLREIRS